MSQNNKHIVYSKTFALLFAADEWAPHLSIGCVRCCVHVSRLSWRACRATLSNTWNTACHFSRCQNAWAR